LMDGFGRIQRLPTSWHAGSFAGATVRKITRGAWALDDLGDTVFLALLPAFLALMGTTVTLAIFRPELVESGTADKHGRVMLQDWELGLAVNHALRYLKPDTGLKRAIREGRMRTRDDVEREVTRMLTDNRIRKPRVLQFFRDYFDHDLAGGICKDNKALHEAGFTRPWKDPYYWNMYSASAGMDRLIEHILSEDRDVFKKLLTTRNVVTTKEGMHFGRMRSEEEVDALLETNVTSYEALRNRHEPLRKQLEESIAQLVDELNTTPDDKELRSKRSEKEKELKAINGKLRNAKRTTDRDGLYVEVPDLSGPKVWVRTSRQGIRSDRTPLLPSGGRLGVTPEGERLGVLTHPAWLVSHTDANGNHPIHRGIWIRERLLGGGIPDVPITVDAQLPDEPEKPLRERMRVTRKKYCWSC
ncbi:MAG: DUF1588 domain-containing protein, partial [Verrucomicrobiota bacterium]